MDITLQHLHSILSYLIVTYTALPNSFTAVHTNQQEVDSRVTQNMLMGSGDTYKTLTALPAVKRQVDILELKDLEKEYILSRSRLTLAQHHPPSAAIAGTRHTPTTPVIPVHTTTTTSVISSSGVSFRDAGLCPRVPR